MKRRTFVVCLAAAAARPALAQGLAAPAAVPPPATERRPLLVPGKTSLFQRVIVRPGATVAPQPGGLQPGGAGTQPVAGFTVFYVYGRQDGWVEVGAAADGRTAGWMAADKAIDWKHTMVASFTNPGVRKPVLFLQSERDERLLVMATDAGERAARMRAAVAAGNPGPVVAVEPSAFVDINRNFYLLPILDADLVERESGPALRVLNVLSAPADPPPATPNAALRDYKAGVVFLIDTTSSMQPYIDGTRDAVKALVGAIGATGVRDKFRFGVVAYRDSLEDNPGLDYATRVYSKPDFAQPPDAALAALGQLKESRVSSTGFDEDPLGGLYATLNEVDWSDLSGRYVILITDAGARGAQHPHSLTRMGVAELRVQAAEKKVAVMVVHLLTSAGARIGDHEPARATYQDLARFNGTDPLYFPVPGGDPARFRDTVQLVVTQLLNNVAAATGVPADSLRLPPAPATPDAARVQNQLRAVGEAMRLNDVRRVDGARAPEVQSSWTTDRDLANPDVFALDVRVLLTRNQLSDLAASLQKVMAAGLAGRTAPDTFFEQLRTAFAAAATDPLQVARVGSAGNLGALLGEYLDGLPYKSEIMDIDGDSWIARGPIAQRAVLNDVESRLRLYQEFQAQSDGWHDLSHTGRRGEEVYPVPLEALP